ncbi:hypothetical protein [Stieleria varia]|uniref:Uncharacterized protein n=2 Tax=Stieleria varia TaxID=2528005 RepID=A0A5C6B7K6_9BACT|nr:hypothetical protein [Stieleria varia]TWU08053.1 hypothetical protein Pla52n_06310 [Stieleria varia]
MMFPYAWIVGYDELDRLLPTLFWAFIGLPAFFPALFVNQLLGQHPADSSWPLLLLTSIELSMGMWLIHLGPKRTIVFLMGVTLTSAMGSLVFYQLCIM